MEDKVKQSVSGSELLKQEVQYLQVQRSELSSLGDTRTVWCKMGNVYLPTTKDSMLRIINYKLDTVQKANMNAEL